MKNVLIIDDDGTSQFLNRFLLRKLGVPEDKVYIVNNGRDALELLCRHLAGTQELPEMIFVDLNMPVMDGFCFLEKFRQLPHSDNVKIVVLSSSLHPEDMKRAMELGATHFIVKPLLENNLREILQSLHSSIPRTRFFLN
jgi:CheY-like chemotaxis protein